MAGEADFTDPRYVEALTRLKELTAYFPDGFIGLTISSGRRSRSLRHGGDVRRRLL